MLDSSQQREFACQVVQNLRTAGYQALWAGGCVRDALLGMLPKDYDVATSATPAEVREVFGKRRTIPIGASFGVITVIGPKNGGNIEVATFRTDGHYSDGRRPDSVQFATPEIDASRRDFTINGLFYDPIADEVYDYVGGQADLEAGIVRAIGDPALRIAEDKLRMLRAIRFAARFDFEIDPATQAAIVNLAKKISQVSGERIGAEMQAMLVHPNRIAALKLLRESGLETWVLPEVASIAGGTWQEALAVIRRLLSPDFPLVLAALLRDSPAGTVATLARRWKLSNREVDRTTWLVETLPIGLTAHEVPWPKLQRILTHEAHAQLVALVEAIVGSQHPATIACHARLALPTQQLNPPPLVSGGDLIAAGFTPGPNFSRWLEAIRDAQLEGRIATRNEAIRLAQKLSGM